METCWHVEEPTGTLWDVAVCHQEVSQWVPPGGELVTHCAGKWGHTFKRVTYGLGSWALLHSCEIAIRRIPQNTCDDKVKSTSIQVLAWCPQAPSHYLSQCCPRSISPYSVTRPQRVNPDCALFLGYRKMYLQFLSFLNTEVTVAWAI